MPRPRITLTGISVFAVLVVFAWMTISVSPRHGVTYDELGHIVSGYGYWKFRDYRANAENGALATRASAFPLLTLALQPPSRDSVFWRECNVRAIGYDFFYEKGNDIDAILRRARLATVVFGIVLLWLVWRWTRGLFGSAAGFVALVVAAFSPTLLAHSGLATSDVILGCCLLAALTAWWRLWHRISLPRVLVAGVTAGLAFTGKMSGILLVPMLGVLFLVRSVRPAAVSVTVLGRGTWFRSHRGVIMAIGGASVVAATISFGMIWAVYGFRFGAVPDDAPRDLAFSTSWSRLLGEEALATPPPNVGPQSAPTGLVTRTIGWARDHRVLPEPFLWGLAYTYRSSRERESFLHGSISKTGFPQFFPIAFLLKSTPCELALALLGGVGLVVVATRRNKRGRPEVRWVYRAAPLLVLLVGYGLVALNTPLNIGHRHLVPIYPVVFILAGAIVVWRRTLPSTALAIGVVALLGAQVMTALAARPFYLSYFTPFVGGSHNGWRHLVDSSYDWGQGLPDLAAWLKEKAGRQDSTPVFLTYFGSDSPRARQLAVTRFADARDDHGARRYPELTGGWYAISATYFQRVYLDLAGEWFPKYEQEYATLGAALWIDQETARTLSAEQKARLQAIALRYEVLQFGRLRHYIRNREPAEIIGSSILLFRLSDDDVTFALNASWPELDARVPRQRESR